MIFRDDLLKDQVAIVTGGGTGLGREMALQFAKLGAKVCVASRRQEVLDKVVEEIAALGGEALAVSTDVRDPEQVQNMVAKTKEKFGRLDLLINNAAGNFLVRAEELSQNGWKTVIDIVLNGTYYCTQAAFPVMKEQGKGAIINIIATYAWTGGPWTVHSASAKAGILAMTKTLAVEWARYGIRINCIAPGPIQTKGASSRLWAGMEAELAKKVPAGRFGTPEEIAQAAVYLASSAGDYITGDALTIDGGGSLNHGEFPEELIDLLKTQREKK